MKRFKFKLQSLLKYRTHLEQMARQEMAAALAAVNDCESRIQAFEKDREHTLAQLEKQVEKGVASSVFKHYHQFVAALEQSIVQERYRKVQLEKEVEKKREMLKKRTIEKKAMERLREKRAQEYTREMLKEEQKGLDEICALKTARELADERT